MGWAILVVAAGTAGIVYYIWQHIPDGDYLTGLAVTAGVVIAAIPTVGKLFEMGQTGKDINWESKELDWRNPPPLPPEPPEPREETIARYRLLAEDPDVDPLMRGIYAENVRAWDEYRRRSPFHPDE